MNTSEYNFLLAIAQQIGVDSNTFNTLLNTPHPFVNIKHESQRIVQFHRLLLLMNIDQKITAEELERIHQLGIKMGLNILAVDKTLEVMKQYDNNNIPSEVLLNIFKTYYN
ncbi:MAG: TerB family tellurite resistance protein [Flavobacteriaceae bacterium]